MRKIHKFLSLVLALAMLGTLFVPVVASAATISFSDVSSDYTYNEAISRLTAEGIINGFEDGTFKPEEPVTRAQYTKILCYALNVGNITYPEGARVSFPDVDPNHWAIDNITTAQKSGIINGYDDGTFKPENHVLYEQAVKMAVCALGYTEKQAERAGGPAGAYPFGYMSLANRVGILEKIEGAKEGEPLTRGRVAQLIDSTLDAGIYDPETGKEGASLREETTVKSFAEGQIVAIDTIALYHTELNSTSCRKGQIELELSDGTRRFFWVDTLGIEDPYDYLGRTVSVYYDNESGTDSPNANNIVFKANKNAEITVNMREIESFSNTQLKYINSKTGKSVTVSVGSGVDIIYNGQAVNTAFAELLTSSIANVGYVTLVCAENRDVADVVFIRTYETVAVKSKTASNYTIIGYEDASGSAKTFVLNEKDASKTITFIKNGKASEFSKISVNDVVSVSESANGKLIDVQISNSKPAGNVSEVTSDGKVKLATNAAKYYTFTPECNRTQQLNAGEYVKLHLDAFDNIARYEITAETPYSHGYLDAAEFGTRFDPSVQVRVYKLGSNNSTLTGTIYDLKENVQINGKNYSVANDMEEIKMKLKSAAAHSDINATIDGTAPLNSEFSQPIRFTTSGSNVIDKILLNATSTSENEDNNKALWLKHYTTTPIECLSNGTKLGNYTINSSTKIILVPQDRTGGTYTSKTASSYFKKGESYYVSFAKTTQNVIQAVYVYGTKTSGADVTTTIISETNIPMIVKGVSNASYLNDTRKALKLVSVTGEELTVYDDGRAGTEVLDTVVVGDVIRVATDDNNLVDSIKVVAKVADILAGTLKDEDKITFDGTSDNKDDVRAPLRTITGLVHSITSTSFVMAPSFDYPTSKTTENFTYKDDVKVFLVDTSNTQVPVSECEFSEIVGYQQSSELASRVMVYTNNGPAKAIIIFR